MSQCMTKTTYSNWDGRCSQERSLLPFLDGSKSIRACNESPTIQVEKETRMSNMRVCFSLFHSVGQKLLHTHLVAITFPITSNDNVSNHYENHSYSTKTPWDYRLTVAFSTRMTRGAVVFSLICRSVRAIATFRLGFGLRISGIRILLFDAKVRL